MNIDFDRIESGSKIELTHGEYKELKTAYQSIDEVAILTSFDAYFGGRTVDVKLMSKDNVIIELKKHIDNLKKERTKIIEKHKERHGKTKNELEEFKKMSVKEFKKFKRSSK